MPPPALGGAPVPDGPLAGIVPPQPLDLGEPAAAEEAPEIVQTAYRTNLQLTQAQRDKMVQYAETRIDEVLKEMGLDQNFRVSDEHGFMAIRARNTACYENDFEWRKLLDGGGTIFAKSNFSLGTSMRHTRYISARVQDDLLGTRPFFAAMGRKPDKELLAKQAEQYIQEVVDRSSVREGLRRGQKTALVVNETTVKTSWVKDSTPFKGPAKVYVDASGAPIKTPDKELYVFENDNFLPSPFVEPDANGDPQVLMLEKDPSFTMGPGQYRLQQFTDLPQRLVLYEGPKSEPLDYRCFLCPLTVPSVHEADINVHVYQETPLELKRIYGDKDAQAGRYFCSSAPTGENQPKYPYGERENQPSAVFSKATVAEVYMRFDADEDGEAEEIFLVLDMDNRRKERAIFYDYLANHFKKRPFEVIVGIEQVPGRWYGRGIYSLNEDQELHIDAEFNRAQVKGSRSSTVLFRTRGMCEEWDAGLPVVIGSEDVLTFNPGYDLDKNPPIGKINLSEENKQAIELMELSRQAADAKVGAISVKDASQSDLNQSKTATGIVNLQAASDVITKATEQDQIVGLNAILEQVVDVTLEHMDSTVLQLNKDASELVSLNRDEIRSIGKDVRLTLTKSRSSQLQAVSEKALAIVQAYRAMMLQDPEGARIQRPFYIEQLKALEVNDADEVCPEITDQMIQAAQQRQSPEPPSKSIGTKFTDLARSEQAQVLQSEGIQPASPEEVAAEQAKKDASEAAANALKNEHRPKPLGNGANGTRSRPAEARA